MQKISSPVVFPGRFLQKKKLVFKYSPSMYLKYAMSRACLLITHDSPSWSEKILLTDTSSFTFNSVSCNMSMILRLINTVRFTSLKQNTVFEKYFNIWSIQNSLKIEGTPRSKNTRHWTKTVTAFTSCLEIAENYFENRTELSSYWLVLNWTGTGRAEQKLTAGRVIPGIEPRWDTWQ
jgi:hypothetical protein